MTTKTPTRQRLDRRRVLETALHVIDQEGLEALTMRRLAEILEVDPMTVHHHAKGKDSLLDGVAGLLWEEVEHPHGAKDAERLLRTLAHAIRALFQRHPEAGPLLLRCTVLPQSELALWRAYLDALVAAGLDQPAATLRSVLTYALGTGNAEVTMLAVACEPDQKNYTDREVLVSLGQAIPQGTPPELAAAAVEMIADCDSDRCFNDGLDLMLAGLAASRQSSERT